MIIFPPTDLFRDFLPQIPNCLEIFARNLNENFTSIGLEVLKLQNVMLFDELSWHKLTVNSHFRIQWNCAEVALLQRRIPADDDEHDVVDGVCSALWRE